jgi:hypothetical protein
MQAIYNFIKWLPKPKVASQRKKQNQVKAVKAKNNTSKVVMEKTHNSF